MERSYLKYLSSSIHDHWNLPAFSNYKGDSYTYADFGERIVKVGLLMKVSGLSESDKVAIVGRNSAGWAMNFFSILSNGYVAVPILHEFKPTSIHHIINHSGAKALFVSNSIWENLDISESEGLDIVIRINDLKILYSKNKKFSEIPDFAQRLFVHEYPGAFGFENIKFHHDKPEELAVISYTSGTSGFSKGVMIPYRALWGNMTFGLNHLKCLQPGTDVVSILPMAHMYGLAFEIYTEVCNGVHIHFLTRSPSPKVIAETFQKYSPILIVAVPMVLEKIVRKSIFPKLQDKKVKLLSKIPLVRERLFDSIRKKLEIGLGGNFYEVIIGGAAFNKDVERFLRQIKFRYTVGYGMTECAPLISYRDASEFVEGSVGRVIEHMEIRIDSSDPQHIVGEIQVRGVNVMLGYYNNEAATRNAFTKDGWLRTGDLGTIDADGNLFIKGRCKNMILGPNGQNIYPEEIEDALNGLPFVGESIVVSRDDKLVALIHPDLELMDREGMSFSDVSEKMKENIALLNEELPAYSKLSSFQLFQDEFEKTPKKSVKRYLYQ